MKEVNSQMKSDNQEKLKFQLRRDAFHKISNNEF